MKTLLLKHFIPLALVPLLFATAGCRSIPTQNPGIDLELANVKFVEATALETTAQVTLRISNESPTPINLRGGVHRLTLNQVEFGKILSSESLQIGPFSQETQQLDMHLSHLRVLTRLQKLMQAKRFEYRLQSKIYLEGYRSHVPITKSEVLELRP